MLRAVLPTAVLAAVGLRDLIRVHYYYPNAISVPEARSLYEQLATVLTESMQTCDLVWILKESPLPGLDDDGADARASILVGMLLASHPDFVLDPAPSKSGESNMEEILRRCEVEAQASVRTVVSRILNAVLYDCRVPAPYGDDSFREPARFLQMLRCYWSVVRRIVLFQVESPVFGWPYPLRALVVNLKARIDACFERLENFGPANSAKARATTLVEIVLSAEPDDLQVVPEWTLDAVEVVDRFIEEAGLELGTKTYPITAAETTFLEFAGRSVVDFEERLRGGWSEMLAPAVQSKRHHSAMAEPAEVPGASKLAESPSFRGGTMMFFEDRVELCGVRICQRERSDRKWAVLELLSRQRSNGSFVSYSGRSIAAELWPDGGQGDVGGLIRDLRNQIAKAITTGAGLGCGRYSVILSGGPGYRLSESITVTKHQSVQAGTRASRRGTDTNDTNGDDTDDTNRDTDDTDREAAPVGARGRGSQVEAASPEVRRGWILDQLAAGQEVCVSDVEQRFDCSNSTALRDFGALKSLGRIEFRGASRSGYYRLKDADGS